MVAVERLGGAHMALHFQHRNLVERIEYLRRAARPAENTAVIWRERMMTKHAAETRRARMAIKHAAHRLRLLGRAHQSHRERRSPRQNEGAVHTDPRYLQPIHIVMAGQQPVEDIRASTPVFDGLLRERPYVPATPALLAETPRERRGWPGQARPRRVRS